MASRFLISGVQLGMINGLAQVLGDEEIRNKLTEIANEIENRQYVGNSDNAIEDDAITVATQIFQSE